MTIITSKTAMEMAAPMNGPRKPNIKRYCSKCWLYILEILEGGGGYLGRWFVNKWGCYFKSCNTFDAIAEAKAMSRLHLAVGTN